MKIAVLGSGMVGQTIAAKMIELGHETSMGTRNAKITRSRDEVNRMTGVSFVRWHDQNPEVLLKNFEDLPDDTELFINAVNGIATLDALCLVGKKKLKGKILLDIANPLDFSKGMPPRLFVSNIDSLAEQIQVEFGDTRVVKGLNTMTASLMVNPSMVPGDHNVFLSGNDPAAKEVVRSLLREMGWKDHMILDLGDITTARGTEMLLPVWLRLMGVLGTPVFNFHIAMR